MNLLHPFRTRRPDPLTIPTMPELVYVETLSTRATAHRYEPADAGEAPVLNVVCGRRTWPFWLVVTEEVARFSPVFCRSCWPGGRCFCGLPSGDSDGCAEHHSALIDLDKTDERRAAA